MKPNFEQFKKSLEKEFGKPLTIQAEKTAMDFLDYWDDFETELDNNRIMVVTSTFKLAEATGKSEYKKYHVYGGFSMIIGLIGIVFLFINWKIALAILGLAVFIKFLSKNIKNSTAKNFTIGLLKRFNENHENGLIKICTYYLSGVIQLVGPEGKAHLPLYASCCLTGETKYVKSD